MIHGAMAGNIPMNLSTINSYVIIPDFNGEEEYFTDILHKFKEYPG